MWAVLDIAETGKRLSTMAILHRSLFTCFSLLAFLILLALKLDKKVKWNWFLVFIPMWIFDAVIVIYITFKMIAQCKNRYNSGQVSMTRKVCYMSFVLLKMSFQVILCMKLEYYNEEISMYYAMVPFWMFFIFVISDVSHGLWRIATRDISMCGRWSNWILSDVASCDGLVSQNKTLYIKLCRRLRWSCAILFKFISHFIVEFVDLFIVIK